MNIGEFKAFLEGMNVEDAPTPEQWARIKDKIDSLQAAPYPVPVPFRQYFDSPTTAPLTVRGPEIGDPPPSTYPIVTC